MTKRRSAVSTRTKFLKGLRSTNILDDDICSPFYFLFILCGMIFNYHLFKTCIRLQLYPPPLPQMHAVLPSVKCLEDKVTRLTESEREAVNPRIIAASHHSATAVYAVYLPCTIWPSTHTTWKYKLNVNLIRIKVQFPCWLRMIPRLNLKSKEVPTNQASIVKEEPLNLASTVYMYVHLRPGLYVTEVLFYRLTPWIWPLL